MIFQLIDVAYCKGRIALHLIKKTYHQKVQDVQLQAAAPSNNSVLSEDLQHYKKTPFLLKQISRNHTHVKSLSPHCHFFLSPYKHISIFLSHTHHTVVGVYSYSVISLFIPTGKERQAVEMLSEEISQKLLRAPQVASGLLCNSRARSLEDSHT